MKDENKTVREKVRDFLDEKGVYVVLLACIAVIGIALVTAFLPAKQPPEEETQPVAQSEDERLSEAMTATPSPIPTATPAPVPDITPVPSALPTPSPAPAREKAVAPVKGSIQWRFAVDELIYSRTLDQWMTHRGVDITAAKGAEVHTPWAGTVEEIFEDDSLGITVRIRHSGGMESRYANLRKDCPVKEGAKLDAGALIGFVGDTAVAECGEGAHLHFELYKDSKPVNPEDFVIFRKDGEG